MYSLITKPLIWDVLHSSVPISGVRRFLQILWILLYIDVKIGTLADSETLVLPRLLFRGIISHCSNSTRWKIIVCWRPLHYSSCTTNIDLMVTPSVGTGHRILWLWHIKMWQPGSVSSVSTLCMMFDTCHVDSVKVDPILELQHCSLQPHHCSMPSGVTPHNS